MQQNTEQVGLIYKKIPTIMKKVGAIEKDRTNEIQQFDFRGIDDVYNTLNPYLAEEGVFVTPRVIDQKREERNSSKGNTLIYSILTIEFTFWAEDGSSIKVITVGEGMDSGDKASNKAMSVAYKYAFMQVFCIPTKDPKDPEENSHEVAPKNKAVVPQKPTETRKPSSNPLGPKDGDRELLNEVYYTRRSGTDKNGKPYVAWFPPKDSLDADGVKLKAFWGDSAFAAAVNDSKQIDVDIEYSSELDLADK